MSDMVVQILDLATKDGAASASVALTGNNLQCHKPLSGMVDVRTSFPAEDGLSSVREYVFLYREKLEIKFLPHHVSDLIATVEGYGMLSLRLIIDIDG